MPRRRHAERPDDFPTVSETTHVRHAHTDGPTRLLYNARGGIYRALISKPVTTKVGERPLPGEGIAAESILVPPGLSIMAQDRFERLTGTHELAEGEARAEGATGLQRRIDAGEIVDLGTLDDWMDVKPRRAADYIVNTGDQPTLRALLEVETRDDVATALEKQLAEISQDRGVRTRARLQNRAHSRQV